MPKNRAKREWFKLNSRNIQKILKKWPFSGSTGTARSTTAWRKPFFPFCPLSRAKKKPLLHPLCILSLSVPRHIAGGSPCLRDLPAFLWIGAGTLRIVSYLKNGHEESLSQASPQTHTASHNQSAYYSPVSGAKRKRTPRSQGPRPGSG